MSSSDEICDVVVPAVPAADSDSTDDILEAEPAQGPRREGQRAEANGPKFVCAVLGDDSTVCSERCQEVWLVLLKGRGALAGGAGAFIFGLVVLQWVLMPVSQKHDHLVALAEHGRTQRPSRSVALCEVHYNVVAHCCLDSPLKVDWDLFALDCMPRTRDALAGNQQAHCDCPRSR